MKTKDLKKMVRSIVESPRYEPMRFKDLIHILDIHHKKDLKMLRNLLSEMVKKQRILCDRDGFYIHPSKKSTKLKVSKNYDVTGILQGHLKGFGFVIPDDALFEQDIFIASQCLNGALDQDHVGVKLLSPLEKGKRPEGEVISILKRGHSQIVGRFEHHKTYGFVIADNDRLCKDIFIPERHMLNAESGDKVVVKITVWPDGNKKPEGKIIEVLGKATDPGIDVLSIFREHGIENTFSKSVIFASEALQNTITSKDLATRKDLRDQIIFTIDGDHAKDFDDAVSLSINEHGNFLLGVHIADVSHYIHLHDVIDEEACARSTSIYAIDQVVPMLPFKLSNDICSLKPDADRLTLSCVMEISAHGQVLDYKIFKSVIHSKARMTYHSVNQLLDGLYNEATAYLEPFESILSKMENLASILYNERRVKRGAINFDFPEAEITLNSDGVPIKIEPIERGVSEHIIEEFMLVANETVAAYIEKSGIPFIFRNHPKPDEMKLAAFRTFIGRFGFSLGQSETPPTGLDFQILQKDIENSPEEEVITRLMLRTMQQAVYEDHCLSHYALGAEYYTHFTSPIRRYPDLTVHRTLSALLEHRLQPSDIEDLEKHLGGIAEHASEQERVAEKIEREVNKIKMTEYMSKHIGETYTAQISGVTSFGFFVELPNTIEGLVRLQSLKDDYYLYDDELHQHVGERFGKIYKLGQTVVVKLVNTDLNAHQIDFELVTKH